MDKNGVTPGIIHHLLQNLNRTTKNFAKTRHPRGAS